MLRVIVDREGRAFTYDVNTKTNYNPDAEARVDLFGMRAIAKDLDHRLKQLFLARGA